MFWTFPDYFHRRDHEYWLNCGDLLSTRAFERTLNAGYALRICCCSECKPSPILFWTLHQAHRTSRRQRIIQKCRYRISAGCWEKLLFSWFTYFCFLDNFCSPQRWYQFHSSLLKVCSFWSERKSSWTGKHNYWT